LSLRKKARHRIYPRGYPLQLGGKSWHTAQSCRLCFADARRRFYELVKRGPCLRSLHLRASRLPTSLQASDLISTGIVVSKDETTRALRSLTTGRYEPACPCSRRIVMTPLATMIAAPKIMIASGLSRQMSHPKSVAQSRPV